MFPFPWLNRSNQPKSSSNAPNPIEIAPNVENVTNVENFMPDLKNETELSQDDAETNLTAPPTSSYKPRKDNSLRILKRSRSDLLEFSGSTNFTSSPNEINTKSEISSQDTLNFLKHLDNKYKSEGGHEEKLCHDHNGDAFYNDSNHHGHDHNLKHVKRDELYEGNYNHGENIFQKSISQVSPSNLSIVSVTSPSQQDFHPPTFLTSPSQQKDCHDGASSLLGTSKIGMQTQRKKNEVRSPGFTFNSLRRERIIKRYQENIFLGGKLGRKVNNDAKLKQKLNFKDHNSPEKTDLRNENFSMTLSDCLSTQENRNLLNLAQYLEAREKVIKLEKQKRI